MQVGKVNCWNCRALEEAGSAFCSTCGQRLYLDDAERAEAAAKIEYLIAELRRWKSVPDWWKKEAEESYRKRLDTLSCPFPQPQARPVEAEEVSESESVEEVAELQLEPLEEDTAVETPHAPVEPTPLLLQLRETRRLSPSDGGSGEGGSAPVRRPARRLDDFEIPEVPAAAPPSEADRAMQMLLEAMSEKRILWLYALGGLLLLSAGVGYLRSSWDGMGRQLMALFLTLLPGLFFWLAGWLKDRLPVSSRSFTVLGGGMLPVGLLSLNTFHFVGLQAPAALWSPFAYLVGAGVNATLYRRAREPICLYLAGLCWALASWSTSSGLWLGLASFGAALFLFTRRDQDVHCERLAHAFSMLGLLAAFTRGPLEQSSAVTLFLLAIAYFSTLAWLTSTAQALTVSAVVCVVCSWWLASLFEWPVASVGLIAVLQGGLYLVRAAQLGDRDQLPHLSGLLVSLVLFLFLGLPLAFHLVTNFADIPERQLLTCVFTGVVGCLYYALVATRQGRPGWLYGSALCLLYAYFSLVVLGWRSQPMLYRPWLIGFVLLWQILVALLRRKVPAEYLRPWVWTAWSMACLLVPLNLVLQLTAADWLTPWIYLGCATVTALAALFERDARGLYVSLAVAALAYAGWLQLLPPSQEPNLGLAFTPFVASLGLLGAALMRGEESRPYGQPLVVGAAVLASGFSWLQIMYLGHGYWHTVPVALALYGGLFALAGWRLTGQLRQAAWLHTGLCWYSAIGCLDRGGVYGVGLALALCLPLLWNRRSPAGPWWAAALWSGAAAFFGPESLKIVPGVLWFGAAALSPTPRLDLAVACSGLLVPAWPGCWENWRCFVLLAITLGQGWLALRWSQSTLLLLAWAQARVAYTCAFGWFGGEAWFAALWVEWLGLALLGRRDPVLPACEIGTWLMLLALSLAAHHGSSLAVLSTWAALVFLLARGVLAERSSALMAASVTLVCAALLSWWHGFLSWEATLFVLFAWGGVDLVLGPRAPLLYQSMLIISTLAWLLAFVTPSDSVVFALLTGAVVWAFRAGLTRSGEHPAPAGVSALWLTFGMAYHAYLRVLDQSHVEIFELYTVPAAGWLLLWGGRLSDSPAARQFGLALLLSPSLFLSLFFPSHALWAGSLALALLLVGQLAGRANYVAWAGLALVGEIVIQAVIWGARNLPWHLWAVVGGVLVVGLAILLERRRQQVLEASRSFLERLNAW